MGKASSRYSRRDTGSNPGSDVDSEIGRRWYRCGNWNMLSTSQEISVLEPRLEPNFQCHCSYETL